MINLSDSPAPTGAEPGPAAQDSLTRIHLIPEAHVVTEVCEDGLLVVDIEQEHYVFLDIVGAHMWQALRTQPEVAEAAVHLSEIYAAEVTQLRTDMTEFGSYLVSIGLAAYQEWDSEPPVEPPEMRDMNPQGLYLDLLYDAIVADVDTMAGDADTCDVLRDLVLSLPVVGGENRCVVLPASLGPAVAVMAAGVLAARGRLWEWRVRVIPDSQDGSAPPELIKIAKRLRLERLWTYGWPTVDEVTQTPPALLWWPRGAKNLQWNSLARQVVPGGIVIAEDVASESTLDVLQWFDTSAPDVTPLSWTAGWWRVPPAESP